MPTKNDLTEEERIELTRLRGILFTTIDAFEAGGASEIGLRELRRVAGHLYATDDLPRMKAAWSEIAGRALAMPAESVRSLDAVLVERFGYCILEGREKDRKAVEGMLARGRLRNEREYRLAREWLDEFLCDGSDMEKVQALDRLVFEFEDRQ